jgi:hypothetical protein
MKKIITIFFVISLIVAITGCGGGKGGGNNDNPAKTGYYYMWSNNNLTSAYAKPIPLSVFNSVVYADEPGKYLGSEIPPFASVYPSPEGYLQSGTLLIYTYYNGAQVKSICTCDPNDGRIVGYDPGSGDTIPSFVAKKPGLFHVTATYNNETIDIPVSIYNFGIVDLDHADLDGDGINDIDNLSALYGYQVINNGHLSLVSSAPTGEYIQTPLSEFTYGKIYVIKTSKPGMYCKIYPTGYSGENDYNSMNFLSDSDGNFDY